MSATFFYFSILFSVCASRAHLYVKEHIIFAENMLSNILPTIALLFKTPVFCSTKYKRLHVMIAIVLKDSTFNRVSTRLRYDGSLVEFSSLPARVFHHCGFTYLYFYSLSDLCYATDFLSVYNAVYRVVETSL